MADINDTRSDGNSKRKKIAYLMLFIIILITLGRIIYSFVYLKGDYHSDEMWSYGLSNSYYEPFIFQNAEHTDLINIDKWVSADIMRDYLTVDREHRFSYDSVNYNQVHDYHPPFYYYILHTICSFFPDQYSPWFGFSINVVVFIVTMVFLYKLIQEMTNSEIVALIGCIFYGLSVGAVNTFVFIRMYCVYTMFSVITFYFHQKLYHGQFTRKNMIILFVVTLLGCLTHHYYIAYAGSISACFCIYYIIKKDIKKLIVYSLVMLGSVAASLLIFPATIAHLFSGRIDDTKLTLSWQIKMTLNCMLSELFGFTIQVVPKVSYTAILIIVVVVLVIISPLFYLFRKETWFINLLKRTGVILRELWKKIKHIDLIFVCMLISSAAMILLTALTVSVIQMWMSIDRYIFNIYPEVIALVVVALYYLLGLVLTNKKVTMFMVAFSCSVFCAASNMVGFYNYFYPKPEGSVPIQSLIDNSDCVFVVNVEIFMVTCFTQYSMDADQLYLTYSYHLRDKILNMPEPSDSQKEIYWFIDDYSFYQEPADGAIGGLPQRGLSADQSDKLTREQFEELVQQKYGMCSYVGVDTLFSRPFSIYRVR